MQKSNINACLVEVRNRLKSTGSTVPHLRGAANKGYSFSSLQFDEQIVLWDHIWKNEADWRLRLQAFFYCEKHAVKEKNIKEAWNILRSWQDHVNDWPFCDGLSKIYTKHLEVLEKEVYKQLLHWNKDKDLWKRRQSIVSLLYYSSTKKKQLPFEKILPLIDRLLKDKEYYVQKGVGWALRELHNVYPAKTYAYLKKNIRDISAIAFSAATEKLVRTRKDELKKLRKDQRLRG
jgi:3-methyladenine DNA glycosylase AlkD